MTHYVIKVLESDLPVSAHHGLSVLDACLEAGVPLQYNCRSGECGECIARLVTGQVKELAGADPAIFNDRHRAEGQILACLCYAQSDLVLSTRMSTTRQVPAGRYETRVVRVVQHGPSIYEVVVHTDAPIDYRSGQYFDWVVPGIAPNRSYSAANRPGGCEVVFHVRTYKHGEISRCLSQGLLQPGDTLTLKGPFGTFGLGTQTMMPAVMVAGGTGLAPLCALLEESLGRGSKRPIQLFFGAQSPRDLYCLDRLRQWSDEHENFTFVPVVVDSPDDADWHGEQGLVTDVIQRHLIDAMGYEAYLCGPPGMIDAATEVLVGKGVDQSDVHADRFLAVA